MTRILILFASLFLAAPLMSWAVCLEGEKENRAKLRKSLIVNTDIKKNQIIHKEMIAIKRPGSGIPPADMETILGKRARNDIPSGTVLSFEMIDGK